MIFKKKKEGAQETPAGPEPRPETVQGKWQCADCGTEITELPFQPSGDRPIYCKECWLKRRDQAREGRGFRSEPVQGNWKCADCGAAITELPFQPAPDRPIYCRDCWRKRREQGV